MGDTRGDPLHILLTVGESCCSGDDVTGDMSRVEDASDVKPSEESSETCLETSVPVWLAFSGEESSADAMWHTVVPTVVVDVDDGVEFELATNVGRGTVTVGCDVMIS